VGVGRNQLDPDKPRVSAPRFVAVNVVRPCCAVGPPRWPLCHRGVVGGDRGSLRCGQVQRLGS